MTTERTENRVDPYERLYRELTAAAMAPSSPTEQQWSTAQLHTDFIVTGFLAPFVCVVRNSDGKTGSLILTRNDSGEPVYFDFQEDPGNAAAAHAA